MTERATQPVSMEDMENQLNDAFRDINHLEAMLVSPQTGEAPSNVVLMPAEKKELLADWAASTAVDRFEITTELADNADTYGSYLVHTSGPTVQRLSEIAVAGRQILDETLPTSEQAA